MAIYSRAFTVPASTEKEFEIEVRGDLVDMVRLRFPPGPAGLLKISIFYGNEQIWPVEPGTFFAGDNEVIQWSEYWPLPEAKTKLKIRAVNEDDTYEHSFYIVINTKYTSELAEERLAKRLSRLINPVYAFFRALTGGR